MAPSQGPHPCCPRKRRDAIRAARYRVAAIRRRPRLQGPHLRLSNQLLHARYGGGGSSGGGARTAFEPSPAYPASSVGGGSWQTLAARPARNQIARMAPNQIELLRCRSDVVDF